MTTLSRPTLLLGSAVACLLSGCGPEAIEAKPPAPRAVNALAQTVRDPARKLRVAGIAAAWKRETLSFQVGGRIIWVTEPEKSVSGPTVDAQFHPGRDGAVIARIDPERYDNALQIAQSSLKARQAQEAATRKQLEGVLPQEERVAQSELTRARENRDRMQKAVSSNAVAKTELTNAQAAFETAQANIAAVQNRTRAMESELEGLVAQVEQARQSVSRAEIDLRDTSLRAPFDGRITQVRVVPGALVQPGTPIADLVMMNPIKIEMTLSAAAEQAISEADQGLVFSRDNQGDPIIASVYQRDTVADSATRTVKVTMICRNEQTQTNPKDLPVIQDVIPLIQFPTGNTPRWFIERNCVYRDAKGTFAWRVDDKDTRQITGKPLNLVRESIDLGDARKDFVGLYQFQEIKPKASIEEILKAAHGITVRSLLFARNVPKGFSGGPSMVVQKTWRFRPGQVLDVQLDLKAAAPGVYVPASAIAHDGDQPVVYVVRGGEQEQKIERVPVKISGQVGQQMRIGAEPIADGAPIVTSGTHVLHDGARVQITSVQEAK